MNELTLTLIRVAFLAVLWLFVIAAIGVVRTDADPGGNSRKRPRSRVTGTEGGRPAAVGG